MEDLDALLADLQNQTSSRPVKKPAGSSSSDDFPPPPTTGTPPPQVPPPPKSYIPPKNSKKGPPAVLPKPFKPSAPVSNDSDNSLTNNLSDLDGLLNDLNKVSSSLCTEGNLSQLLF